MSKNHPHLGYSGSLRSKIWIFALAGLVALFALPVMADSDAEEETGQPVEHTIESPSGVGATGALEVGVEDGTKVASQNAGVVIWFGEDNNKKPASYINWYGEDGWNNEDDFPIFDATQGDIYNIKAITLQITQDNSEQNLVATAAIFTNDDKGIFNLLGDVSIAGPLIPGSPLYGFRYNNTTEATAFTGKILGHDIILVADSAASAYGLGFSPGPWLTIGSDAEIRLGKISITATERDTTLKSTTALAAGGISGAVITIKDAEGVGIIARTTADKGATYGVHLTTTGITNEGELETGSVDVTATGTGSHAVGIYLEKNGIEEGSSLHVGEIIAAGGGFARGIEMQGDLAGSVTTGHITVEQTGSDLTEGEAAGSAFGLNAAGIVVGGSGQTDITGTLETDITGTLETGDITVTANEGIATGIFVSGGVEETGNVTTGNITAEGQLAQGIQIVHSVASNNITVGEIEVAGLLGAVGIGIGNFAPEDDKHTDADLTGTLTLNGNITATATGAGLIGTDEGPVESIAGDAFGILITANVQNKYDGTWDDSADGGAGGYVDGDFKGGGVIAGKETDITVEASGLAVGVGIAGSISTGTIELGNITATGITTWDGELNEEEEPILGYAETAAGFIVVKGITVAREEGKPGVPGARTYISIGDITVASEYAAIGFGVGDALNTRQGMGVDTSTITINSIDVQVLKGYNQNGVAQGWWSGAVADSEINITNGIRVQTEAGSAVGIYVEGHFSGTLNTGTIQINAENAEDTAVAGIIITENFTHQGAIGEIIVDAAAAKDAQAYGIAVLGIANLTLTHDISVVNMILTGEPEAEGTEGEETTEAAPGEKSVLAVGIQMLKGGVISVKDDVTITAEDGSIVTGGNLTLNIVEEKTLTLGSIHFTDDAETLTLDGEGTLVLTGSILVENIDFKGAAVDLGHLTDGNSIQASAAITFTGETTVYVDAEGIVQDNTYTLMTFGSVTDKDKATVEARNLGNHRGGAYFTEKSLKYDVIVAETTLNWTGGSATWSMDSEDANWNTGNFVTYFKEGDTVFFGTHTESDPVEVTVAEEGVKVAAMTVTGTNYIFNLTVGEEDQPAIYASGNIDLGNAVLNITGYTPGDTYGKTENDPTVILAGGTLSGFNPAVTIANQSSVDFLSASAYFDENAIKVATVLAWYSTDPMQTHGTFTIGEEGEVFTLGANLEDVDVSGEWDGKTLTKKGEGWLYLTGDNTYTGDTVVEKGYLLVNTQSLPGDAEVHADAVLKFAQELEGTYTGVLSGEGLVVKTGEGTLMLSGDSSDFEGDFWLLGGDLHLTETAQLGGTFEQDAGTTFTSKDGATLGNAVFQGTVTPEGTLNVESAIFEEATIELGHLSAENKITAAGEMFFIGTTDINVDADGIDLSETYTLMSFDGYDISGGNVVVQAANLGGNRGGHYFTDEALKYDVLVGNTSLTWKGIAGETASVWDGTSTNWTVGTGTELKFDTHFKTGDTVVFDDTATNKNVSVAAGGVTVAGMTVEETGYTFNLIADETKPAITSSGTIDLGDATLNITGISFDTEATEPWRLIQASSLVYSTPNIVIEGLASDGFISVEGDVEDNKVIVTVSVNWVSDGANAFDYSGSESFTLGGDFLTGGGSLTKTGTGTLILTGNNSGHTGTITVGGGTLIIGEESGSTASVGGSVTVNNGGTLGGHGSIGGNITIASGGTLTPGNSIGKITAGGNVLFESGSSYSIEIDTSKAVQNDCLVVETGGNVTIQNNATLNISIVGGVGSVEDKAIFNIIQASAGQITGQFTSITGTVGMSFVQTDANGLSVVAHKQKENYVTHVLGASPNVYNVAVALNKIVDANKTGDLGKLYEALMKVNITKLADALDQLHGEVYAASQTASANLQHRFVRLLPSASARLSASHGSGAFRGQMPGNTWNRWGTFTGDWSQRDKLQGHSGYTLQTFGVAAGIDRKIGSNMLFGGAFAYDNVYQDFKSIHSEDRINAIRALLYSGWRRGNIFVDSYAGYSKNWHETERTTSFSSYSGVAKGKYDDDILSAGIEVGHLLYLGKSLLIPSVGLHYVHISTPAFTETGGLETLRVASSKYDSLRLPIGFQWSQSFSWRHGIVWTPELRAFYVGELGDTSARVRTSFGAVEGVTTFDSESGSLGRSSGRIGLGLNTQWSNRMNFRLDYELEVYEHTTNNQFGATLGVNW